MIPYQVAISVPGGDAVIDFSEPRRPDCRCTPAVLIPRANAVAVRSKSGWTEYAPTAPPVVKYFLTKTVEIIWGGSTVYDEGPFGVHQDRTYTGTFTGVYHIDPITGIQTTVSESGTFNETGSGFFNSTPASVSHWDFTWTFYNGAWRDSLGVSQPDDFTPVYFADLPARYRTPPNGYNLISIVDASTTRTTTGENSHTVTSGSNTHTASMSASTTETLSEEFTTEMLETQVNALLSAAESYYENLPLWIGYGRSVQDNLDWTIEGYYGGCAVGATACNASFAAAVTAATAAKDAAVTALGAADASNAYEVARLTAIRDERQIALDIATDNATAALDHRDAILCRVVDGADTASENTLSEDEVSLKKRKCRYYLSATLPAYNYDEKEAAFRFDSREALIEAGASTPDFTNVISTITEFQHFPTSVGSNPYWFAATEEREMNPPVSVGYKIVIGLNQILTAQWQLRQRSAAMQKLGFLEYKTPSTPPKFYRKETASGSREGSQGWFSIDYSEDPELPLIVWEYSNYFSEDYPAEKRNLLPGEPNIASMFNPPGEITSPSTRIWQEGEDVLTLTLSDPWETSEIQSPVDAFVETDFLESDPPMPSTGAIFFTPGQPWATRFLTPDESFYVRARAQHNSLFTLPESVRLMPDFETETHSFNFTWKKHTLNLETGEQSTEDVGETISYDENSVSADANWRNLDSPGAEEKKLIWITAAEAEESDWFWGSPACVGVCE